MDPTIPCHACIEARKTGKYGCSPDQRWEVHNVRTTTRPGLLYIEGWNHCSGDKLFWGMNDTQIRDWTSCKGYDWRGIIGASSPYPRKP